MRLSRETAELRSHENTKSTERHKGVRGSNVGLF